MIYSVKLGLWLRARAQASFSLFQDLFRYREWAEKTAFPSRHGGVDVDRKRRMLPAELWSHRTFSAAGVALRHSAGTNCL